MRRFSKIILPLIFTLIACILTFTACNDSETREPTSSGNINAPTNGSDNSSNDEPKYSKLLQNVLTNEYYNSLIDSARSGNSSLYESGAFQPHPYAFLEEEGFDVEAIQNKQLDCYTMSYVLDEEPNNLYMFTRVNDGSVVYNYLLMYELTDQEMKDYDMTHDCPKSVTDYYVQAVFMNNEISQMKTPKILGTSKMTVKAFEGMTKSMSLTKYVETHECDIIMINPNKDAKTFELILVPKYYENNMMAKSSFNVALNCKATISINGGVYVHPYDFGPIRPISTKTNNAKFYYTQKANLNLVRCQDLEES